MKAVRFDVVDGGAAGGVADGVARAEIARVTGGDEVWAGPTWLPRGVNLAGWYAGSGVSGGVGSGVGGGDGAGLGRFPV